ncbi:class I SAM-dependent DNA methyltransferase [Yoonia sp. 2307UL14-13]|uniref:class I SAM-dependent DNA methyltransferase n=1 Tax=Yoonia sp. 2307UL14-13 TaxID=3126506 RepID=UPI0030A71703
MTDKKVMRPQLWAPRSVEDTMAVYAEWAETYDQDVLARGYHTPDRIAAALKDHMKADTQILDFGCGTGIGAKALQRQGLTNLHGTDISAEMLEKAEACGIYDKIWLSQPGELSFGRGAYPVIVAAGVISLGAAPADLLGQLIAKLDTGNLLALSFNDPTLADNRYADALGTEVAKGRAEVVFREHGPHLDDVDMGSDIIILRRR